VVWFLARNAIDHYPSRDSPGLAASARAQVPCRAWRDIFTVGVGQVELVEAEPRREGRLMLHPEQRRVPTSVGQNLR
jgi:hypothetical protein